MNATFESPLRPYIEHYPLLPRAPLSAEVTAGLRADSDQRIRAAVVILPEGSECRAWYSPDSLAEVEHYLDQLRRDAFVKIYVPELAKLDEKKAAG